MLKKLQLLALVVFLPMAAFAQSGSITGKITDATTGEPLPGATVFIESLQKGMSTDTDGNYNLTNVPVGSYELIANYIGYKKFTTTVQIGSGQVVLDIQLSVDLVGLEELVVTGYGTVEKRELTGSITRVSSKEFDIVPVQNTESILQGRAAGVNITTTSGNPGGAFRVQIRGNGSIGAATEPLYIVDGVQISFSQQSNLTSQSPLNSLNPNDIESIEVLKDAAAAAIYGSQAAAGVVVITTKKGSAGTTKVTARAETGVRNVTRNVDYISTEQYLDYVGEAWALNAGVTPVGDAGLAEGGSYLPYRDAYESFFGSFFSSPNGDGVLADTDWQDFIYDTGVSSRYNASASGGNDKTRFFISGGLEDTEGHIFNSNFSRYNVRTNIDHQATDRLTTSVNINLARTKQFGICQDGNFINCPPSQAMFEAPMSFPFNADGSYNAFTRFGQATNPAVIRDEVDRNVRVISITGTGTVGYKLNDWLNFRGLVGVDYRGTEDERWETPIARPAQGGRLDYNYRNVYNFNTNAVLNAAKTFDGVHNVSGLVGGEYRRDYSTRVQARGEGFPGSFFRVLNASATPATVSGTNGEFRIASYFANAKYNYDDKYFLSFIGRYDGHSRFGADTRWGFFPSVSGAWRISEEDFFTFDTIDELKLRVGYGTTGNASIGNFTSRGLYSVNGSYNGVTGVSPNQLANATLTWEEAVEINLGLDYSLFQGRVNGAIDVYQKDNNELLLGKELPTDSGYGSITENVGSIRNSGIEFELSTVNVDRGGFLWSTRFNTAFLRNEVTALQPGLDAIRPTANFNGIRVGRPLGSIFVPEWAGVNPADGRPMWYDIDGNITYTPEVADRKFYKNGQPDMVGGFGNTMSYKGLSLDVFFQFSFGQWAFAQSDWYFTRTPDFLMNLDEMVLDRWRVPGDVTYYPRAIEGGNDYPETSNFRTTLGTHSIYNASYIRLKNASLSYSLPVSITEKLNVSSVRLYASGINLATWTAWPFYDPEVASNTTDIYGNVVAASYPTAMQFNGGIEIQF